MLAGGQVWLVVYGKKASKTLQIRLSLAYNLHSNQTQLLGRSCVVTSYMLPALNLIRV